MANEMTTTTLTEVIEREAYAASVLYFAEVPGVSNFVARMDLTGQPTLTARFPIYDKVSAQAVAEMTDFTTNAALDPTAVDVTVSEHAIRFVITDLAAGASRDQIFSAAARESSIVGRAAAEALQRRQDQDLTALFSGFDSSTGSNSGAITSTLLIHAIGQLDMWSIPRSPRTIVLHPFQWRTLIPVFDEASTYGVQGQQVLTSGLVSQNLYGANLFVTANVATATISTSTVYAGAVMHPSAIALATKGDMPSFEVQRDASLRAFEVVATGVWGEAEYRGGATTAGRGGAGVLLYSNSTVA
jgi:hypothetical protein